MYEVRHQDDRTGAAGSAGHAGRSGCLAVRAGDKQAGWPGDRDALPGHGPARGRGLGGKQLGRSRSGRARETSAAALLPADPGRRRAGTAHPGRDLPDPGKAPSDPERRTARHAGSVAVTGRAGHQLRVRIVMHAGEVRYDSNGCFGEALDMAFRLLAPPGVKKTPRATAEPLTLVISQDIYRAIVRHGYDG